MSGLKGEERTRFYERNKPIAVLMIVIVLMLPIMGAFAWGLPGAVLAVVLSVLAYYFTPYLILRLRA